MKLRMLCCRFTILVLRDGIFYFLIHSFVFYIFVLCLLSFDEMWSRGDVITQCALRILCYRFTILREGMYCLLIRSFIFCIFILCLLSFDEMWSGGDVITFHMHSGGRKLSSTSHRRLDYISWKVLSKTKVFKVRF